MPESDNKTKQLIEAGTEIAGAAVSGALGFLFGGPAGAAGAGALGVVVAKSAKKLITDMANRHLSHQEEIKVGAAAAFAMSVIEDRLKKGDRPRDDDFFTKKNGENSSAEEIFEGVLLKSKNEHEEKKIKLLGNFFANLAFAREVSPTEANHLLKVAEGLTYRQMCLLTLFYNKPQMKDVHLRRHSYRISGQNMSHDIISLSQEIVDMYNQGLLECLDENGSTIRLIGSLNASEIIPDNMAPTPLGKHLAMLLGLDVGNVNEFNILIFQLG